MTGYVATRWYRAPEIMLNWMRYSQTGKKSQQISSIQVFIFFDPLIQKIFHQDCFPTTVPIVEKELNNPATTNKFLALNLKIRTFPTVGPEKLEFNLGCHIISSFIESDSLSFLFSLIYYFRSSGA
jgi:hypothetical protein